MVNGNNDNHQKAFLSFAIKYVGIISAVLAVGLVFAFSTGNIATLVFTLGIALMFFLILMLRWDDYKRGALFTLTAICVNVEHVSRFRTDYVFESIPEDDTTEPQIFILAEKRTKFKRYYQGVPYIMVFGMQKNCRELTSDNLVTASKCMETYDGQAMGKGFIDLSSLDDEWGAKADAKAEDVDNAISNDVENRESRKAPLYVEPPAREREGDSP